VCNAGYRDVARYVREFPEFDLETNGLECYVDSEGVPAIVGSWLPRPPGTPGTGPEASVFAAESQCGARHRFQLSEQKLDLARDLTPEEQAQCVRQALGILGPVSESVTNCSP
jgi:hypothetical protein